MEKQDTIRQSMLWSAYGDALGFMTELADGPMVRRRVGASEVTTLVPWKRRVGGRFGVDLELPKGCYSDDTQLRLATCRAIRHDGTFDVDVFAKVELPVWRAYALGAGTGTKAAAQSLGKPDVQWSGNFFDTRYSRYVDGGGNGAAMRIQPHVWAAKPNQKDSDVLRNIIRNAVTTHGHPRGILGAVFHGFCLLYSMTERKVPSLDVWRDILGKLSYTAKIIKSDNDLATFWVPCWENVVKDLLDQGIATTLGEIERDVAMLREVPKECSPADRYAKAVHAIGGLDATCRGSGTKTALLASYLAICFAEEPVAGLRIAANLLGSDTDTIATMGGALLGCTACQDPPEDVLDKEYMENEAKRLFMVSQGRSVTSHTYPDLLHWQPPTTEIDVLGLRNNEWLVAGLGRATPVWEPVEQRGKTPMTWQWFVLECGQHVLLKRRPVPRDVRQTDLPFSEGRTKTSATNLANDALQSAIASNLDPAVIGEIVLRLARQGDGKSAEVFAKMLAAEVQLRNKSRD